MPKLHVTWRKSADAVKWREKLKIGEMTHETACYSYAIPWDHVGKSQASAQEEDKVHWQSRWWEERTVKRNNNGERQTTTAKTDSDAPSILNWVFYRFLPLTLWWVKRAQSTEGKGKIKQCQQRQIACIEMSVWVSFERTHVKKRLIQ